MNFPAGAAHVTAFALLPRESSQDPEQRRG